MKKIRFQGLCLIVLGLLCHKVDADGAAVLFWLLGAAMLVGKIEEE